MIYTSCHSVPLYFKPISSHLYIYLSLVIHIFTPMLLKIFMVMALTYFGSNYMNEFMFDTEIYFLLYIVFILYKSCDMRLSTDIWYYTQIYRMFLICQNLKIDIIIISNILTIIIIMTICNHNNNRNTRYFKIWAYTKNYKSIFFQFWHFQLIGNPPPHQKNNWLKYNGIEKINNKNVRYGLSRYLNMRTKYIYSSTIYTKYYLYQRSLTKNKNLTQGKATA